MLEALDALELLGATDVLGLLLGTAGGDDRQAAGQQVVTAVAILDLDGVSGDAQVLDLSGKNQFHLFGPYRVDELNGSRATSRAFFTAIAMSR